MEMIDTATQNACADNSSERSTLHDGNLPQEQTTTGQDALYIKETLKGKLPFNLKTRLGTANVLSYFGWGWQVADLM